MAVEAELEGVTDEELDVEPAVFDDAEDAKIMQNERVKSLKRKGIKVIPKEKAGVNGHSKAKKQRT